MGPESLHFSRASVAPKNTLEQQDQNSITQTFSFQLFVLGGKKNFFFHLFVLLAVFPERWALGSELNADTALAHGERDAGKQIWGRTWGSPGWGPPPLLRSRELLSGRTRGICRGPRRNSPRGGGRSRPCICSGEMSREGLLICVRYSSRQEKKTAGKSLGTWAVEQSEGNRGRVAVDGEAVRGTR